ncbi:MAG: anaerobic ribonucleoside-triphosphate reductase activating protein [Clostridiales bacterium]|nr:anaerobic ribonucleoside-triphosphate reductase activating protein [Clostridiales bacterium]
MNIQGFQKMTLLDYPGKVACTVFTGGCNLRCPFCHNAELVLDPFEYKSVENEVIEYLNKRKGLIDGVCITGGEPLLQKDIVSFINRVRELGYKIKLDTNGTFPDKLNNIIESKLVDYIAMDIKYSVENYDLAVGCNVNKEKITESIKLIKTSKIDHEFRTTAVKGIHSVTDFEKMAQLVGNNEKYYIQMFVDSGNLIGKGVFAFNEQEMKNILIAAKQYADLTELRGI